MKKAEKEDISKLAEMCVSLHFKGVTKEEVDSLSDFIAKAEREKILEYIGKIEFRYGSSEGTFDVESNGILKGMRLLKKMIEAGNKEIKEDTQNGTKL